MKTAKLFLFNLQLRHRREQSGAVDLQLIVLLRQTELNGEEVAGGQLVHLLIVGAQRRQANLLRELRKALVGEQGTVAEQLVAAVRLWRDNDNQCKQHWIQFNLNKQTGRVEGITGVANVLCAVEDAKRQTGHKVPRGKVASNGAKLKTGSLCSFSRSFSKN